MSSHSLVFIYRTSYLYSNTIKVCLPKAELFAFENAPISNQKLKVRFTIFDKILYLRLLFFFYLVKFFLISIILPLQLYKIMQSRISYKLALYVTN